MSALHARVSGFAAYSAWLLNARENAPAENCQFMFIRSDASSKFLLPIQMPPMQEASTNGSTVVVGEPQDDYE